MLPFKKIKLFFFILCLVQSLPGFSQGSGWELKKNENGISVYTRGAEDSDFKELKSVVVLKTSLSSIVALLNDFESYPQWVFRCGKSSTLKRISETEVMHYQTVTAPWPVDNRDFVVDVKLTQDQVTKVVVIKSESKPDYIPEAKDHVRIKKFRASWTLTPLKDGSVEVTYQLLVDPSGYVPAWIINLAVVDGPYETSLHLKDWVKKDKYQKAIVSYIKE
jgi:ribosome-associated toxin RatA of RatAB toxin-antitoxin module